MEVVAKRGNRIFIVKKSNEFFLVNLDTKKAIKAKPPDKPDMFLKFGYFDEVDTLSVSTRMDIITCLKNI